MTDTELRDTFAAAALTGLLSSLPNGDQYHPFAVENAWSLADAMLRERCNVKTPNDAKPMAGSGPTVPANDRASDCSEDGRVRASASSIGNTQEPVAWAALRDDGDIAWIGYTPEGAADGACGRRIVPLYRHRQPTLTDAEREATAQVVAQTATSCGLTDAEREAVETCIADDEAMTHHSRAATLRGLLERMGATNKTDSYDE